MRGQSLKDPIEQRISVSLAFLKETAYFPSASLPELLPKHCLLLPVGRQHAGLGPLCFGQSLWVTGLPPPKENIPLCLWDTSHLLGHSPGLSLLHIWHFACVCVGVCIPIWDVHVIYSRSYRVVVLSWVICLDMGAG